MKSKWVKLLIVFSVVIGGSWMIGHFTKDPWRDRLISFLTMGSLLGIDVNDWVKVGQERSKYYQLAGVLLLGALTIFFAAIAIYSALHI